MRLRNIPSARQELDQSPYVIKEECYSQLHGNWARVFGNDNPVRIEIGMGKGQFLLELAGRNPEMNYVGIERYSSVLVHPVRRLAAAQQKGAVILGNGSGQETGNEAVREGGLDTAPCMERKLDMPAERVVKNILLLRMDAEQVTNLFGPGEVERIYLNFSDPWPKDRHARRRLPGRTFLKRYAQILAPEGQVEFKTDNRNLFDFAIDEARSAGWAVNACTYDLHHDPVLNEGNIMTEYEKRFSEKGNPICKLIITPPLSDAVV